jgi:hypothetical protein
LFVIVFDERTFVYFAGELSDSSRNISSLTALPRSDWAKLWKANFKKGNNRKSITSIEKAILLVVLSDKSPTTLNEKGKFLLHGDGKTFWYDKTVNVVFFKNGHCGLNVEHTTADAPVIIYFNYLCIYLDI